MSRNFEERVLKNMRLLHISREEAEEIVRDEDIIDKGGKCDWEVELTPEQKKAQRRLLMADRAPSEKKGNRRAENPEKRELIAAINACISGLDNVDNLIVTNVERELTFNYNGVEYKVALSAPRPKK